MTQEREVFTVQKNIKMREGMPELIRDITKDLDCSSENEAIELLIVAGISNLAFNDYLARFNDLRLD